MTTLSCALLRPFSLVACALLLAGQARAADDKPRCAYVQIASVPVHYTGPGLQITIDGIINGTPAAMLADTGAYHTAMTRTGTEKRGLPLRMTGEHSYGIGGISRLYNTRVDEFRTGPARTGKGWIDVLGDTGDAPAYDALVGAPFLLQTDLEISMAEKQFKFFRPKDCADDAFLAYWDANAIVIPFEYHRDQSPNPHFTVEVNGEKMDAIIDSGASVTVIDSRAAKRAGLKLDAPGVKRLADLVGIGDSHVAHWSTVVDRFSIGRETVRNAEIGVMETNGELDVDVLLGDDFLRAHRVLFAMSQKKLYISYTGGDAFRQRGSIEPWMQQEADAGNPDAQYYTARIYDTGHGVPRDPAKATDLLEKAAALGHPYANLELGRKLMGQRRWVDAATHLRGALDKLPADRYGALMLYVARLHTGAADLGKHELESSFERSEHDEWPAPIADFYLGRIDAAALLDAAGKDARLTRTRTCAATFYAAQLYDAHGDTVHAESMRASYRAQCTQAAQPKQSS
jgi:predicted aspartyl protease